MTSLDASSMLVGTLVGIAAGLIIGYFIWRRNRTEQAALGDLRWSQLIGSVLAGVSLIISAPESVTIAFIALIPAENVALGIARRAEKS